MTESELIDALFSELESCVGVTMNERRDRLFPYFSHAGEGLTGDAIRESIRSRHALRYGRIHELVDAACVQWDDWRYAVEHWQQAALEAVQSVGSAKKPR
jgi:hypothetical protein